MTDEVRSKSENRGEQPEQLPDKLRADLADLFGSPAPVDDRVDRAVSNAARGRFEGIKAARGGGLDSSDAVAGKIEAASHKPGVNPFGRRRWWLGPAIGTAIAACLMFAFVFMMPEADRAYDEAAMSAKPQNDRGNLAETDSALTDAAPAASGFADEAIDRDAPQQARQRAAADSRTASRLGAVESESQNGAAEGVGGFQQLRGMEGIADDAVGSRRAREVAPPGMPASPQPATAGEFKHSGREDMANAAGVADQYYSSAGRSEKQLQAQQRVGVERNAGKDEPAIAITKPSASAPMQPSREAAPSLETADRRRDAAATDGNELAEATTLKEESVIADSQVGSRDALPRMQADGARLSLKENAPADADAVVAESPLENRALSAAEPQSMVGGKKLDEVAAAPAAAGPEPVLPAADVDQSGVTDVADVVALARLAAAPGEAGNANWDVTGDGRIDDQDLQAVARMAVAHMTAKFEKQREAAGDETVAGVASAVLPDHGNIWLSIAVPVPMSSELVACQFTIRPGANGRVSEVVMLASSPLNRVVVDKPLPAAGDVHVAVYTSRTAMLGKLATARKAAPRDQQLAADVSLPVSVLFVQILPGDAAFRPDDLVRDPVRCVFSDMTVQQLPAQVQRRQIDVLVNEDDHDAPAASREQRD